MRLLKDPALPPTLYSYSGSQAGLLRGLNDISLLLVRMKFAHHFGLERRL